MDNSEGMYYNKYKKYKIKYLSLKNINKYQKGGVKNVLIHIAGPQGSGKTTIGNKLKEMYGNKIYMKDLDDLYSDFHQQDSIKDYQEFINNFISSHKDKPLILVGLDADLCLGPTINPQLEGYQIQTSHKYYIDIDFETNLKQWFFRQVNKLSDRKEVFYNNWLKDNKKIQDKIFGYVDINERKKNKIECDNLYKKRGYQFMNYEKIFQECKDILKLD
jgi:adenylate kinase family enzyme